MTEGLARRMAAAVIVLCEKDGCLESLASAPHQRDALSAFAREELGLGTRAALTTANVPLPTVYGSELRELVSDYGVVRARMARYPIGMGTAKPARMGTRPVFGAIAMSGAFAEKSPTLTFASLESHKLGGIVRLPREIDEQSIVSMGEFLARYGAVEFARSEDEWGFLADGTATYDNVSGIVKVATDNNYSVVLGAGELAPSDVLLEDFRALRTKVNKAALSGRRSAYYMDTTWESRLRAFNTAGDPFAFVRLPNGEATLDGYPIVWTDVLTPYSTTDSPSTALAVFGALGYWWFGEHGYPRVDTSEHVYFVNDQVGVRFIEEIDFDYCAIDAAAVLLTAAA